MDELVARLQAAGCIAADEEAAMLRSAAGSDAGAIEALVVRRERGEPVEWIVGWAPFCGLRVNVAPGVYVPRAQTEVLARRAAKLLPAGGRAADLATGSGAVALVLKATRSSARVVATEVDPTAVACARSNGVDVLVGDLDQPLPVALERRLDVLTANVPYVPTSALALLPRDVREYEPRSALDGGADGLDFVRRVLDVAPRWLRPGTGRVLIEIGPDQAGAFPDADLLTDEDGDVRAIEVLAPDRISAR